MNSKKQYKFENYEKYILKKADVLHLIRLAFWVLFRKKKYYKLLDEIEKGKTFRAAFDIALNN